jgi:hypothetical protein
MTRRTPRYRSYELDFEYSWRRVAVCAGRIRNEPLDAAFRRIVPSDALTTSRQVVVDPLTEGTTRTRALAGNTVEMPSIVNVPPRP